MNENDETSDSRVVLTGFAIGVSLGLLVVLWLWFSRPADELLSSGGFNLPVDGSRPSAAPFPSRPPVQSGLGFVRAQDVGEARPEAAGASALAPAAPTGDAAALAQIGAPSDRGGLARLGAEKGLLGRLVAGAAASHPAALRALLNNKTLVDAYFARPLVAQNCASGASLKSYLSNGSDPQGVSEEVGLVRGLMRNPDAASAAVGTEFASRLLSCPSVGQLASNQGAVFSIAGANPALAGLVGDPAAAAALASNPQAMALLGGVQSALSSPRMP